MDPGGTTPSADRAGMLFPAIPVGPIGRLGTLPPSDSDPAGPDGPSVTGGPVGQLGTLSPSTFASATLVDPGGTLPSSDLARMLLPAISVNPVGIWGTLSSSDSDPASQDGPHVTGGPVGHLGTLSPSTSESEILVDPGGMLPSSDLAEMRGPAPPAGSAVLRGPVGPAMSFGNVTARNLPDRVDRWSVAGGGCSASVRVGPVVRPVVCGGAEGDWCGSRREEPCCARWLV